MVREANPRTSSSAEVGGGSASGGDGEGAATDIDSAATIPRPAPREGGGNTAVGAVEFDAETARLAVATMRRRFPDITASYQDDGLFLTALENACRRAHQGVVGGEEPEATAAAMVADLPQEQSVPALVDASLYAVGAHMSLGGCGDSGILYPVTVALIASAE